MREGDKPSGGEDGASTGLDEFLCEYVDGTMDPAVRAAFEEYLRQNPELYEHVECLRETRSMLCRYGCRLRAPAALQQRLRERLGEEMFVEPPVMPAVADRLTWIAGFSSIVLLLMGFLATDWEVRQPSPLASVTSPALPAIHRTGASYLADEAIESVAPGFMQMRTLPRRGLSRAFGLQEASRHDTFLTSVTAFRPTLTSATLP